MDDIGTARYVVAIIEGDFGVACVVKIACTWKVDNVDIIVAMDIGIAWAR